jgi:hypothetical protein
MERSGIIGPTDLAKVGQTQTILRWLKSPRGLVVIGVVIITAGLALGWNWVVAFGLAPLVLSVAPCAAMCALGLCMMPKSNPTGSTPGSVDAPKPPE